MPTTATICELGSAAVDFDLPGVDGRRHRLADLRGPRGLLLMFICNHCPYVKAILPRIVRDAHALQAMGIGVAAISSNDAEAYPEDAFPEMISLAWREGFRFPYLYDAEQQVARDYDVVCTPDFYGYDANLQLRYHGRLDGSRKEALPDAPRELFEAMRAVAEGREAPEEQVPSIGCSIKWRKEIAPS